MKRKAMVFWFTGLSGSGKTTLANAAFHLFLKNNKKVKIYDGDVIRKGIHKRLTFTPEDINENNMKIAEFCLKNIYKYDYILVPVISPFRKTRSIIRKMLGDSFRLIYVKASMQEVVKRDVKNLYHKALAGKIKNFIGIDKNVPYEPPEDADLVLDTEQEAVSRSINKLVGFIRLKQRE